MIEIEQTCLDIGIWFIRIFFMKLIRFYTILSCLIVVIGCETPQSTSNDSEKDMIKDLTVQGLRDTSQEKADHENLMNFRILRYSIIPGAADELEKAFSLLSREDVRAQNSKAFSANGLNIGVGSAEQVGAVARTLTEIGAVRISSTRLIVPPVSQEIVSNTFFRTAEKLTYANSTSNDIKILLEPGFVGWVLSAKPDPRFRGMAQVDLFPAYWQPGIENIRLLMGKDPVEFQPFQEGHVLARLEERGFILLGPGRNIPEQATLDKLLYYIPGPRPKVHFFIIVCDSSGT